MNVIPTSKRKVRICLWRFVALGIIGCIAQLALSQEHGGGPKSLKPPVAGLVSVDFPGLAGVEPTAAKQLREARDSLYQETLSNEVSVNRLAAAYGLAGRTYHAYSFLGTAEQCYRNAEALMPLDYRWRHVLGIVLAEQNKPYMALEAFKESSRLNGSFVPSRIASGNIYLALNLNGLAAKEFEAAETVNPDDPSVLYGIGRIKYEQGKYKEASAYFEKVIELVPAASRVRYSLAMAYKKQNEDEKAREQLAKQGPVGIKASDPLLESIERLRTGTASKLLEAKTAMDAGQVDAAVVVYKQVLDAEPDNVTALVNIGAAYVKLGNGGDAFAALKRAEKIEPENSNVQYNLGVIYALAGKPLEAVSRFKSLLKSQPDDHAVRLLLAGELRKAGLLEESMGEYRRVVEMQPENETALLEFVSLLDKKGMHGELFSLLEEMHRRFPSRDKTAGAYAFALLTSPNEALRDANTALRIAEKAYQSSNATEHGVLVVLSLAKTGKCMAAMVLAGGLLEKAKAEKKPNLIRNIENEIERIKKLAGEDCVG